MFEAHVRKEKHLFQQKNRIGQFDLHPAQDTFMFSSGKKKLCTKKLPKEIKGIKGESSTLMKNLSLFVHPHDIPNLYNLLSSVEHKRRYFEKCLSLFFWSIQWKSMVTKTVSFIKIFTFVFQRRKKVTLFSTIWGWTIFLRCPKEEMTTKQNQIALFYTSWGFSVGIRTANLMFKSSVCKETPQKKSDIRCHLGCQHFFSHFLRSLCTASPEMLMCAF